MRVLAFYLRTRLRMSAFTHDKASFELILGYYGQVLRHAQAVFLQLPETTSTQLMNDRRWPAYLTSSSGLFSHASL